MSGDCDTITRGNFGTRLAGVLRVGGAAAPSTAAAQPLRLIPRRQFQQRLERAWVRLHLRMRVADRREPRRDRSHRKVGWVHLRHLRPGQRRGHPRIRQRPHRVSARRRPVLRVLVVVQKHPVPLFLPPLRGRKRRHLTFHGPSQRQSRPPHLRKTPLRQDRHVDVDAARARGLRIALEPHLVQRRTHRQRYLPHLAELNSWLRVQVDPQLVRMVEVRRPHRMRVQLHAAQVDHPCQRRRVIDHDLIGRPPGRKGKRHRAHILRQIVRRALLVKRLAMRPVHEALQHDRPVGNAPQHPRRYSQKIPHQLQLADLHVLRKVELVRIRDAHRVPIDLEHFR